MKGYADLFITALIIEPFRKRCDDGNMTWRTVGNGPITGGGGREGVGWERIVRSQDLHVKGKRSGLRPLLFALLFFSRMLFKIIIPNTYP